MLLEGNYYFINSQPFQLNNLRLQPHKLFFSFPINKLKGEYKVEESQHNRNREGRKTASE